MLSANTVIELAGAKAGGKKRFNDNMHRTIRYQDMMRGENSKLIRIIEVTNIRPEKDCVGERDG